ncbi:unnamed protein product, partial [Meganyctiphanes norvegica]
SVIGAAICRVLVEKGMKVVGAAKSIKKVQAVSEELVGRKGSMIAIHCDITKDEDVLALFESIKNKFGGVDVCINSASLDTFTTLLDGNPNKWRNMLNVNVVGLCLCTREAIASMQQRGIDDGQIIHLNNIAGHYVSSPGSVSAMYTASKFAVTALTEGLRQELRQA